MTKPSFCSSPWILGAPQSGFSSARRRIKPRISSEILGRPPRGRERQRQYNRKPVRCQPTTVAGCTITKASAHPDQNRRRVVQKNRSRRFNCRRGRFRLRTASCCRSARISSAVSLRLRRKARSDAARATIESNTDHPFYHGGKRPRLLREVQSQAIDFRERWLFDYTHRLISEYFPPRLRLNIPPGLEKTIRCNGNLPPGWETR